MHSRALKGFYFLVLFVFLLALCWPFLYNPLIFDDQYLFLPGKPQQMLNDGVIWASRWWVYQSLAATFVAFEGDLFWLRLGNVFAHMATVLALYFLVRRLLLDLDARPQRWLSVDRASFLVAVLFAIHPLAVFTQAYLVQRTIVCATFFLLLSLYFFWCGLRGSKSAFLLSCFCCAVSVYAKEHAIMLPFCTVLLVLLHWRSSLQLKVSWLKVGVAILIQFGIAFIVVLQLWGLVGQPYEMMLSDVLDDQINIRHNLLYPLSFLNQMALFFKYGVMWVVPSPWWVSIDIRDTFPLTLFSWYLWLGAVGFVVYVSVALSLLWRGSLAGLVGFAALVPAALFATEFSVVRLQEPFVLYRSYLWAPFIFLLLAVLVREVGRRLLMLLVPLVLLFLVGLSFARLSVFSQPIFVWEEAAELLERKGISPGVFGGYRIFHNLGNQYFHNNMLDMALINYEKALANKPNYAYSLYQRGVIRLRRKEWVAAQADFQAAILEKPKEGSFYAALAEAFEGAGSTADSSRVRILACEYGRTDYCAEK